MGTSEGRNDLSCDATCRVSINHIWVAIRFHHSFKMRQQITLPQHEGIRRRFLIRPRRLAIIPLGAITDWEGKIHLLPKNVQGKYVFLSLNMFVELEIKMVLTITYLEFQTVTILWPLT